ncbi:MAG: hypothetical protein IPK52_20500 [Chloroflexi bacterium]|nr:hypothetical protein [Chloroflexota bacterium]
MPPVRWAVSGPDRKPAHQRQFRVGHFGLDGCFAGWQRQDRQHHALCRHPRLRVQGVPGKTSAIRQVVNGAILTAIQSGDTLCASAMVYTKSPVGRSLSVRITVKYSDGTKDKSSQPVALIGATTRWPVRARSP